jgi:hypothetical protein
MSDCIEINIRSTNYLIALSQAMCGTCRKFTSVVALVVPPGHEVLDSDADTQPESEAHVWQTAPHGAFLFHVEYLPDAIRGRLGVFAQFFRRGSCDVTGDVDWSNHCERCGCRLEDQELFCEPESAFFPTSKTHAEAINLIPVDEPFQALAAGYSPDPEFLDLISRN